MRRYNRGLASERELIRRARAGDQDAFAELVMMHADRVYGALRRFGLDAAEADEVAQEVFVRAWRGLGRFEERSRFSTWLYRITTNVALNYFRDEKRTQHQVSLDVQDAAQPFPTLSFGIVEDLAGHKSIQRSKTRLQCQVHGANRLDLSFGQALSV